MVARSWIRPRRWAHLGRGIAFLGLIIQEQRKQRRAASKGNSPMCLQRRATFSVAISPACPRPRIERCDAHHDRRPPGRLVATPGARRSRRSNRAHGRRLRGPKRLRSLRSAFASQGLDGSLGLQPAELHSRGGPLTIVRAAPRLQLLFDAFLTQSGGLNARGERRRRRWKGRRRRNRLHRRRIHRLVNGGGQVIRPEAARSSS